MSRSDRTLSSARGASSSVVERLADLYGSGAKPGKTARKSSRKASGPTRSRRPRRSRSGYSSASYGGRGRTGPSRLVIFLVAAAVVVAGLAIVAVKTTWVSVMVTGLEDGQVVRGDQLEDLEVRIRTSGRAAGDVTIMLNGAEIPSSADNDGGVVRASLAEATNGPNIVSYRVHSSLPLIADHTGQVSFMVRFGPSLSVPAAVPPPTENRPAVIRGLVSDDVIVEVNGEPADREAGAFTARVKKGAREAVVTAVAPDGSVTKAVVEFADTVVYGDPVQAYHISSPMWRDPEIQDELTRMANEGRINAVELTVKDEAGMVGYASALPLAQEIGANARDYDIRQAIDHIHGLGLKAIGRVVAFLDPKLARWAHSNGRDDMLIQDENGEPLESYYGSVVFTNPGNEMVRQYNIELAIEAAQLGFDHILYDYVRRPEGELDYMKFPGMDVAPPVAIATFVKETRERLPEETKLGLSVFGIAASRPIMIAQDVRLLAPLVDYIAPMVYPSHWGPGEYKVPNPLAEPGKIVERSVKDFVRIASAGGAYTIPWLQDFDTGDYSYGAAEVTAQIDAAMKSGASGYMLWNPRVRYDYDAMLPMDARVPPTDEEEAAVPTTIG